MISISIVEDHDLYRFSLVKMLESVGQFELTGVYTCAEEALAEMVTALPDVAIIDIELKEMSGIALIKALKPIAQTTQFLICTSYQDSQNVFNALTAGASGYIMKGATSDEIQNAIVELHNGGAPMSPYIARKVIGFMQQPQVGHGELTSRELEIITLLSNGLIYKEISERLSISLNTVKNHLKSIYKKLHVQNKVEAINKYKLGER